jgi:hypothetical protein
MNPRRETAAELADMIRAVKAEPRGVEVAKPAPRERTTRFTVPIRLSLREALEHVAAEIDGRVRPTEQTIDKVASTDVARAAFELLAEDPALVARAAEKVRRARGW